MNEGEEKITYAESDKNHSRTSQVSEYIDGLGTTVHEAGVTDASGKAIIRGTKAQDPKTKSLLQAKTSIQTFCEKLGIPDRLAQKAKTIFKDYLESSKRKPKGANSDSMILAILYMALKEDGASRDFPDLAQASKEGGDAAGQIKKSYAKLRKALPNREGAVGTTASDFVSRFCADLGFPESLKTIAIEVARKASAELEGKFPSSVAAASILYAADQARYPLTAQDIAKATGTVAAPTIKNAYKTLCEKRREDLLPSDFEELVKFANPKTKK